MRGNSRGYETFEGHVTEFASGSVPSWPKRVRAREEAPNVIIMLIDDLGFSDLEPFGSEIPTPNMNVIASRGWTFTNYRTAPLCSPSRAALLTGLNPHRAGFGTVAHVDPGYPGFNCELPENAPTLAESLRAGGYATFMVGKWHLTGEAKLHDAADRSSWPLQRGFDRYFGCMDGFTSLHHPHRLIRDNSVVDVREFPAGYYLTDQLVDESLAMIDGLRANDEEQPFFLYFAHSAVHGPLQAKATDIARHEGLYSAGWNQVREQRFAQQKRLGIIAQEVSLPKDTSAPNIPDWSSLSQDDQNLFARHMEVYAAVVDSIDQSLGRIMNHLKDLRELENTLIVIASDNGGTAEGGSGGTRSYFAQFGHEVKLPADWVTDIPRDLALLGGPQVHGHYPAGWGRVSNTPFRSFKGELYDGGVHAPLLMYWPQLGSEPGGLRDQSIFVSDLTPTILDLVGVPPLARRKNEPSMDMDGRSMAALLTTPTKLKRPEQYFECGGKRALLRNAWKAVSPVPPLRAEGPAGGRWELYDLASDPTETTDLGPQYPALLEELTQSWVREAWQNTVFPLDDDGSLAHLRPASTLQLTRPVTLPAMRPPLERFRSARLTVLRSFTVQIRITCTPSSEGVLVAHGDQGGGYLLALQNRALLLSYNAYGVMHRVNSPPLPSGTWDVTLSFKEITGLRWDVSVHHNNVQVAVLSGLPMLLGMAPFTGISVGYDYGGPVDWELHERHGSFSFREGILRNVRYVPGERSRFDPTVIAALGASAARFVD